MSIPVPAVGSARRLRAFTLIEVLLASTLTAILLGMLLSVLGGVLDSWNQTSGREESYRDARAALQIFGQDFAARVPQREGISPLIPDLQVASEPNPSGKSLGFLCRVSNKSQPSPQNQSDICAAAYYVAPIPGVTPPVPALYRQLLPSDTTFTRLQGASPLFPDPCSPAQPNAEVVAQNVTRFEVRFLDSSYNPLPLAPAGGGGAATTPAHVEIELQVINSRAAQVYFSPETPSTRKAQILQQDSRKFTIRHPL